MDSIVYSGKNLKNLETIENDLKSKSKNLIHLDLSVNYLK